MVTDFLELARLDATDLLLESIPLDLGALVSATAEDFRALAQKQNVALKVAGDARRLGQVVTNLVSNALKFTPSGGRVELEVRRQDGGVETAVQDTGRGIPAQALATLFDRYTRVVENDVVPGTGLGLIIVREIVEAHGGTLGVESIPGAGSRFWFRLPQAI